MFGVRLFFWKWFPVLGTRAPSPAIIRVVPKAGEGARVPGKHESLKLTSPASDFFPYTQFTPLTSLTALNDQEGFLCNIRMFLPGAFDVCL